MRPGYLVIEGVYALENGYLVRAQLERLAGLHDTHLARKLILRHVDALTVGELCEVLVQELHVQALRALEVVIAVGGARSGFGVYGFEVVVEAYGVALYPAVGKLLFYLLGRGGLARARGS